MNMQSAFQVLDLPLKNIGKYTDYTALQPFRLDLDSLMKVKKYPPPPP